MLHLLRQFIALAETSSFTQAGRRLNLSQPALTKSIHNLEHEFGGILVERTNHGCTLTDLGKVLYRRAKVVENEVQLMYAEMSNAVRKQEKHVTIGYGILWQVLYAARIIVEVERRGENRISVTGKIGSTEKMLGNLLSGGCDIFLGQIPPALDPKLIGMPLLRTKHAIFVHKHHPLLGDGVGTGEISLEELSQFQWLLFGSRDDLSGYKIPEPLKEKVEVRRYHDINSLFIIITMLQNSDSLILLPQEVGPILALYEIYAVPNHDLDMPHFNSGIIYRSDGDSDVIQTVIDAVKDVLPESHFPESAIENGSW